MNPKKTEFDWSSLVKKERVQWLHNARGATDWVVALLPKSLERGVFNKINAM